MSEKFTVVLDAGHGGTALADGSTPNNATGANGLLEKDLTLEIARLAAAKLDANNFQTVLTRNDDRNLPLAERARKSRESGADAFVSIHFNGHKNSSVDGTEVYISKASDEKDAALANELVRTIALAASLPSRGVRKTDFTILKGDFHVAKTAACLIEMAYLTNPQQANKLLSSAYVEHLAAAVAQSVANYANQISYAASFAEDNSKAEKIVAEVSKEHADPKNFPIDLPEMGKGTDTISISIPQNLKFSRWEIEVLAMSTGAGYKVSQSPKAGAEGVHQITIDWWHLPYGKINYKFKAYASRDGRSAATEKIVFDKAGWMENAKDQIAQGVPLQLAVKGDKAKLIYEAIQKYQASQKGNQASADGVAIAMEPITITVVILVGIVIFGILVALGLFTLGAIIKMALDKGYNVKDTKYKAAVGEGQTKQEHEIAFNISKPEKALETAPAQSFPLGLNDDLDAGYFQPLDYSSEAFDAPCGNSAGIKRGEEYVEFAAMPIKSKRPNSKENVFLRWCDIPKNKCEVDVVIHLHGWDIRDKKDKFFFEYVVENSGLDLLKPDGTLTRQRPTLCILPFGEPYQMPDPEKDSRIGYNFPFLTGSSDGLQKLKDFSLKYLSDRYKTVFNAGRLILTAHSGGGKAILAILGFKKYDVSEVHLFDSTYESNQQKLVDWANAKINEDAKLVAAGSPPKSALRVLYQPFNSDCNTSGTAAGSRNIEQEISGKLKTNPNLSSRYRVQPTRIRHTGIPKTFGFQLLADASSKLDDTFAEKFIHPCCQKDPAKCGVKEPFKQQSLSYEYEDPDYFAASETNFRNY